MASHPCKQPVAPKKPTVAKETKGAKVGNTKKDKNDDKD